MNTLGWGIIGCGDVVERKSGPSIEQADRSRIVAVMRRDADQARAFAEAHAVPAWSTEPAAVLENADVEIVYVATPPNSHLEYVLAAACAGKHVLVEKPMAMSASEGRRMIAACDEAGVQLFVAYYRRFWPHVQAMRELIRAGRIGEPVQAIIDLALGRTPQPNPRAWRDDPAISGGGYFVDVGSHRLDSMHFLLGELVEAQGVATLFSETWRVEKMVTLALRYASGAQGVALGDYASGRQHDRFAVHGTLGSIVSDNFDSRQFELRTAQGAESFAFDPLSAPHLGLIRHIERVLAGDEENQSSGRDGLMTEVALDAAVRDGIRRQRECT